LGLPSEPIILIVADDRLPTFLDNHAPWLLDQETIALAHLAAGRAHVVNPLGIILGRRWHEGALRLRCRRPWRCSRWLQRRWSDGGFSDRLLWRNRTRRLAALTLLLLRGWWGLLASLGLCTQ
jgi:hypothetical protein